MDRLVTTLRIDLETDHTGDPKLADVRRALTKIGRRAPKDARVRLRTTAQPNERIGYAPIRVLAQFGEWI